MLPKHHYLRYRMIIGWLFIAAFIAANNWNQSVHGEEEEGAVKAKRQSVR